MFRSDSPFGNDTSSYAGSIQSNGFSTMDDVSSQASNISRPSAKSVYLQRMEYAVSLNKMMETFQYRVEHLFTCDLNGKEMRSVADCVERLKLLDGMGRVWAQSMLLEIRGSHLLFTDVETKEELESMALSDIVELKAVPDSGAISSLLTVSVQFGRKHTQTVFMFQCEDVRAELVQKDFARHRDDISINSNTGSVAGRAEMKNLHNAEKFSKPKEPQVESVPQWSAPDYASIVLIEEELDVPQQEEEEQIPTPQPYNTEEEEESTPRPYTELERNVDILNHIVSDIEIFMGKIAAAVAKNSKKKKKMKAKGKAVDGVPPAAEFADCLHKIKCGFNLVGELNGQIDNPSAPEFVHSFFSTLGFVVSHCPEDLPQTIVAPLLTPVCIRLMSEEASAEEDQLWQSLGDAWNIPSTKWPDDDEDIPTYTPEFFDGWQPPEVSAASEPKQPVRRQENPKPAPSQTSAKWTPANTTQKPRPVESKGPMRVVYDFISRNHRELTVTKGEIVQLLDRSKQWWKVRNNRGEEGFVPNNVLEDPDEQPMEFYQQTGGSPILTKKSKSAEVKAWLEDKGFSKITVRCLGVLSGSMLLGMSREELKQVCPEEGGRVFFQLQAVRSAMAVSQRA
ncbi:epidermal growth factor receptor kinase substrate 8-like protein 3 isoform X1 [Labrus bergylta]|uniref:epidermal growth factor receptor kinase substrate 8-like protein 3 isoform X1 n=1 Tax=Labrus bergylta TaxID=56723 RepID=UPI0010FB2DE2|nr:epidermal growth factor receptor kinase substrate 8-like protein 3 [Labrus bergylta]